MEQGSAPEHLQYIDDIVVWGDTAEDVFKKGEQIIQILLQAGFAIKRSKVKGPAQEIQFLGIKWQDGRRHIPADVIDKITAMSPPINKKETQSFLGVVGFWRMHVPNYSLIVSPLYQVTRKKNDFTWGPEQQQAFEQIKHEIARAVALGPVRTGQDVKNILYTAAGEKGPTWSLWQRTSGETRGRPLGFWSRAYRGSEECYTPTEKEILAAYEGVRAASEVVGTETQLLLAPRLPVLNWMFKGKIPSTHHATDATWSKWIALITQRARMGNFSRPGILEVIMDWPEGKKFETSPGEEVSRAKEAPPYNELPGNEKKYAPINKKETQSFLGVVGFWRMHVPNYSLIVSPLYQVTRKKNDFTWGPEQQQAFEQIKHEIARAVALGPVRTGQDVKNILYTAAGEKGPTWSLWQRTSGETRGRPLGFWSRAYRGSEECYTPTEKEILAAYEGVRAASEVVGTETQLLLAPRLPVLNWMFKGKIPSTHHATDATWSKWIALITQRARMGNFSRPGILEVIMDWPEGKKFETSPGEEVSRAKEAPPYNELPGNEKKYALFTDGSCRIVGKYRRWKAAVWSPVRQVAEATEGKGESSQFAEVKAVQLALDVAEREGWPVLYLYTDSWMVANALWGWLQQWEQNNWQRRGKPIWSAELWKDIAARIKNMVVKVRHVDAHMPKSRATEEQKNNHHVDQAAKIEVAQIDLDWQNKGELFLARWAHETSGHQGRDATYKWARDRGVDLTMDAIAQVIHDCETCAIIKQAKRLQQWEQNNWQRRGKPIWSAELWKDIAARIKNMVVKVRHVDAHMPKSRATEEQKNNHHVDQAAKIEVAQIDLDWQNKGELFLARWAHETSGHQGRDATYKWARDRGVDLTMDAIAQVIHDCETCAIIKQAKRMKPLWEEGRWQKYKYGEAWQIDYITLPRSCNGKRYVLTMVEATTGWLETYAVPHATARNTILGLEKQVLW